MIIVAGGDSFVFGSELKDQDGIVPSLLTYPALLASMINSEYRCVAKPGNANNAISRSIIAECERIKGNNVGAIVTWTFTNRYEFRFNYNTGQRHSPWYSINSWSILDDPNEIAKEYHTMNLVDLEIQKSQIERAKKTGISDFAKVFFRHVGDSEYYELYSSLKEILFLQFYFEQNNIPYLFLPADNHFYNHPNYYRQQDECLDSLYKQIKWNQWFFFEAGSRANETQEPRGFYQWAMENKYPVGTTHPLEEAHAAAANLIKEKFNELVTKSLEQNSIRN
jgi:hypothetical protein